MATEYQMPKLGLTMESGTILEWMVPDLAEVSDGDVVMRIETDKVETDIGCSGSGILKQHGAVGETYDCGQLVGWFLEPGEEPPAVAPPQASAASAATGGAVAATSIAPAAVVVARGPGGRLYASPNAKRVAAERGIDINSVVGTGPGGRIVSEDVELAASQPRIVAAVLPTLSGSPLAAPIAGGGQAATFAARSLAELLGIDVASVPGQPGVRLTREDVAAHVRTLLASAGQTPTALAPPVPTGSIAELLQEPTAVIPLRAMRGTIAKRMHQSLHSSAQLTLFMDVDMTAVVADRSRRRAEGDAPGFTDYVIAATAAALLDHPAVNSQVTADGVAHLPDVHVGMAVALDDGLVVPVIRDTTSLSIDALSSETSRLAEAARSGLLSLDDMSGSTFSVTALGMFGVDGFTPIINTPNTAILGVGRLRDDVVWVGDTPTKATMLTLSLTWDHRAFDGAPAAAFAGAIKTRLESVALDAAAPSPS